MGHHSHWDGPATEGLEPFTNALRVVSGGVHNFFAANVALGSVNDPFTVFAAHPSCRAEAFNPRTHLTRTLGQRLCQLRRIDVTIIRIPKRAFKVVGFDEGIGILDVGQRHHLQLHPLIQTHGFGALELHHALARVGKADRSGHVIVHRIVHLFGETGIERQ